MLFWNLCTCTFCPLIFPFSDEGGAQDEGDQKKKKKLWSISIKKKSSEEAAKQKEEKSREKKSLEKTRKKEEHSKRVTEVAIATPPKLAVKHSEVELSEQEEKEEVSQAVISLDSSYQSTRWVINAFPRCVLNPEAQPPLPPFANPPPPHRCWNQIVDDMVNWRMFDFAQKQKFGDISV